jgi:hypothetical protein
MTKEEQAIRTQGFKAAKEGLDRYKDNPYDGNAAKLWEQGWRSYYGDFDD